MPSSAQNDAPTTSSIAMPGRDAGGLVRREELRVDTERSLQLRPGAEVGPVVLVPHEEEVPVLHDVERQPVLLREPEDHRHARERQLDVDPAGELMAEPARRTRRSSRSRRVGSFEEHDVLDARRRPGGTRCSRPRRLHRRPRRPPSVIRCSSAASTAARATIRSSNASPTDLKTVMSSGDVRTLAPRTTSARSATTCSRTERALADRDAQLSGLGERRVARLDDDPGAQHRDGVELSRRGLIAADGVHVHARREQAAVEQRHVAGRARADRRPRPRRRSTSADVGAEPRSTSYRRRAPAHAQASATRR